MPSLFAERIRRLEAVIHRQGGVFRRKSSDCARGVPYFGPGTILEAGAEQMPKTVLITGSSSGIGRATAQYFAAKGWNVAATARDPDSLGSWARTRNIAALRLDVTDESTIATSVAVTIERFGAIDVLVNNAGFGLLGPLEGATAEQFESQFRTNVFGTAAMIRHVLPTMRTRRSGSIINISSIGGRLATPLGSAYYSSKFAIEGLSESLQFELRLHGIRVKLIEPGHFKTDFTTRSLRWAAHGAYEPQLGTMMAGMASFAERGGDVDRVAEAVFKAANDSSGRLRYPVGGRMILAVHAILPDAVWRWMIGATMNMKPRARGGRVPRR